MSPNALERPALDANRVACGWKGVRRKRCALGADAECVHLLIIDSQRCRAVAHDIDDACGLNYRKPLGRIDADKDISRKERILNLPSNPVFPPSYAGVERQKGLDLLCYQLSLDELFMASSGVDGEPLPFRDVRVDGSRFDTRLGHASIQNRGDKEHSIPPCQKRFGTHSGARFRGKEGALTKNAISLSLIHRGVIIRIP